MKKFFIILSFLIIVCFPTKASSLSVNYVDKVSQITSTPIEENKINIYLFYGQECPHCEEEKEWLNTIIEKYQDHVNIYDFEVWHNKTNKKLMDNVKKEFDVTQEGVPLTIIGDNYFVGYSQTISSIMENIIKEYSQIENSSSEVNLPILGNVDMHNVSIPITAIILGFIDGFNPCAMWILLFLINMLFGLKSKKRAWLLGLTFLFISAFVYFLSMLGISFVLNITAIKWLKIIIVIFILVAGILNIKKYISIRKKDTGCTVTNNKKRKKLTIQIRKIIESKSFILSFIGIIVLAASVNLIELTCSLGFPLIFTEILSINNITGLARIIYLLLYI